MSFEGFDAAPLIENADFWPGAALPAEAVPEPTNDLAAAMREIAQAPRAGTEPAAGGDILFDRDEARLVDLWVREGENAYRIVGRPDLGASASLHAMMMSGGDLDFRAGNKTLTLRADFIDPDPGNYVDENGNGQYDEGEEIIVTGTRPKTLDDKGVPWDPKPGDDTGGGGGDQGGAVPQPLHLEDCAKDNKAFDVATTINGMAQGGFEYGAIIYKDANGNIVSSSIAYGTRDGVSMSAPPGTGILNILGQVHSHPATGNAALDAAFAVADMYPSPQDWLTMGQIALQLLAAGGDPNQLSIYIIDHNGFVREFAYGDRAIYDVPLDQLLQKPGEPPLPPLPGPMLARKNCGAGG